MRFGSVRPSVPFSSPPCFRICSRHASTVSTAETDVVICRPLRSRYHPNQKLIISSGPIAAATPSPPPLLANMCLALIQADTRAIYVQCTHSLQSTRAHLQRVCALTHPFCRNAHQITSCPHQLKEWKFQLDIISPSRTPSDLWLCPKKILTKGRPDHRVPRSRTPAALRCGRSGRSDASVQCGLNINICECQHQAGDALTPQCHGKGRESWLPRSV